jgi:uncharacterized lipoprotein YddW (UPF0748 family)
MRKAIGLLFLTLLSVLPVEAQMPKREFRGAWIATVSNLDWPSQGAPASEQQAALVQILDGLKAAGINAVVFQIRPEGDALYRSSLEPWSYYLTGQQGRDPGYDPLAFAIQEAHRRGMELHAWFNPFRAYNVVGLYTQHPLHFAVQHPEWVMQFPRSATADFRMFDPGRPQVRDHSARVVADVVRRYDVDGVHFDDYFYPYPVSGRLPQGITNQDDASCNADPLCAQLGRGSWRRENVNRFVKQVADSIRAIKPWVKYGISPFGIWRPGTPPGINGLDAYGTIYADALTWLQRQNLDYLTPQLYWGFGGGQDYATLAPWWKGMMNGRHLYPGLITTTNVNPRQIRFNRSNGIPGQVIFRAQTLFGNSAGVLDSLRNGLYARPALLPTMPWKGDVTPPYAPTSFRQLTASGNRITLTWRRPEPAADGDTVRFYALYRGKERPLVEGEDEDAYDNLVAVFGGGVTTYTDTPPHRPDGYYYVLTALDENWNESSASSVAFAVAADAGELAAGLALEPPYPNPARGAVTLRYRLDRPARVQLSVFDALGRRVADLEGVDAPAGPRVVVFDSAALAPGRYVIRLQAGPHTATQALTVTR